MNKEALFEFIKTWESSSTYSDMFDAENAMFYAQEADLINEYELVNVDIIGEKRWGVIKQYVFDLFGTHIAVDVYEMTSETGTDLFNGVYEVEPYEMTVTKYRRKSNVEVSDA